MCSQLAQEKTAKGSVATSPTILNNTLFADPGLKGRVLSFVVPAELDLNPDKARDFFNSIETQLSGYAGREYYSLVLVDINHQDSTREWLRQARSIPRFPAITILSNLSPDLKLDRLFIQPLSLNEHEFKLLDPRIKSNLRDKTHITIRLKSDMTVEKANAVAKELYKSLKLRLVDERAEAGVNGFVSIPNQKELANILKTKGANLLTISVGKELLGFVVFFIDVNHSSSGVNNLLARTPNYNKQQSKVAYVDITEVTPKGEAFGRIHGLSIYDAMGIEVTKLCKAQDCQGIAAMCRIDPAPAAALSAHASRGWKRSGVTREFLTPAGNIGKDELILLSLSDEWAGRKEPLKPMMARKKVLGAEKCGLNDSSLYEGQKEKLKFLYNLLDSGTYVIGKGDKAYEIVEFKKYSGDAFIIDYKAWNTKNDLVVKHERIDNKRMDLNRAVFYLSLALESSSSKHV